MNKRIAIAVCFLIAIVLSSFIIEEGFIEGLKTKLWSYIQEHPTTSLHVHTDKNVYSPAEKIWFKAYVLSGTIADNKVLYVRVANDKKQVVAKAEFPVYDVRSNGDLFLPDSLKDGKYFFYAFTDRMTNFTAADVFVQPITIHRNKKKWQAEAYVIDSAKLKRGEKIEILVRLKEDNNFVKDIKGKYLLLDGDKVLRQRSIATNNIGEAYITFQYPDLADDKSLTARIQFESETEFEEVNLNLRHEGNRLKAAFYPEGGHFIAGAANKLAIEIQDVNHNPVATQVVLKHNAQVIASATANTAGIATLLFTPAADEDYSIEVDNYGVKQILPFKPLVETSGYILNTIVKDGNTSAIITNKNGKGNVYLVLRSFDEVLWSRQLNVPTNNSETVALPVSNFGKQLLSADLIDESGKVVAERLLMNNSDEDYRVVITTDNQTYGMRKKVTATITITDKNGQPVSANCSVAAIEKNTLDERLIKNITQSFQYKNTSLLRQSVLNNISPENLDPLLLTQSWDYYQWDNILPFRPVGKLSVKRNTDGICGVVTCISKKTAMLKTLHVLSNNGIEEIAVNASGYFSIPSEELVMKDNKTKMLVLNNDFYEKYSIEFMAYDADFDKLITTGSRLDIPRPFNNLLQFKKTKLDSVPGIKRLDDVIVRTTKNTGEITEREMEAIQNALCASYVCVNNILNCPNHKSGTAPIIGNTYRIDGRSAVYRGCYSGPPQKTRIPLKIISTPADFIHIDYDKDPSKEPEVRTTLYWNPNIYTDKSGKATFTFFTNDIKSSFKIMLQGVTARDVKPLQGSCSFNVK